MTGPQRLAEFERLPDELQAQAWRALRDECDDDRPGDWAAAA